MNCPHCGEPIETRHTFCVVCGADLMEFLESKKKRAVSASSGSARRKVHAAKKKLRGKQKPAPEATGHTEQNGDPPVIPEFLQPNV